MNTQGSGKGLTKSKARHQRKNKGYYERLSFVMATKKEKRANRAENKKAYWIKRGVKKNGKPVKGAKNES